MNDVYLVMSCDREGHRRVRKVIAENESDAFEAHHEHYPEDKILSIRAVIPPAVPELTGAIMNRMKAVQQALDGRPNPVYLEIGVSHGAAFRRITADQKIAVDPAFKLSARSRRLADAKARTTHYFETTSDAFFANET